MKAAKTRAQHKKHAGHAKHHAKAKHTPTAHKGTAKGHAQKAHRTATQIKAAKARALSLGDVSCCAADALAASARLAGWPVAPADVLALYRLTADSPDAGASILATLDAAYLFGLAGVRPVSFQLVDIGVEGTFADPPGCCGAAADLEGLDLTLADQPEHGSHAEPKTISHFAHSQQAPRSSLSLHGGQRSDTAKPLLLGLELPGPHAVLAYGGLWQTWGEWYDPAGFPDAMIEEAWEVTWP